MYGCTFSLPLILFWMETSRAEQLGDIGLQFVLACRGLCSFFWMSGVVPSDESSGLKPGRTGPTVATGRWLMTGEVVFSLALISSRAGNLTAPITRRTLELVPKISDAETSAKSHCLICPCCSVLWSCGKSNVWWKQFVSLEVYNVLHPHTHQVEVGWLFSTLNCN